MMPARHQGLLRLFIACALPLLALQLTPPRLAAGESGRAQPPRYSSADGRQPRAIEAATGRPWDRVDHP